VKPVSVTRFGDYLRFGKFWIVIGHRLMAYLFSIWQSSVVKQSSYFCCRRDLHFQTRDVTSKKLTVAATADILVLSIPLSWSTNPTVLNIGCNANPFWLLLWAQNLHSNSISSYANNWVLISNYVTFQVVYSVLKL